MHHSRAAVIIGRRFLHLSSADGNSWSEHWDQMGVSAVYDAPVSQQYRSYITTLTRRVN
jgi:hypothetical protein